MPKCGTTSLHEAFLSAGFGSVHWALGAGKDLTADKALRTSGLDASTRLVAELLRRATVDGRPPLAYLPEGVDAVAEMNGLYWEGSCVRAFFPQMSLLDAFVDHYPHAHFILNVRDTTEWVRSVGEHNDLRKRLIAANLPGLPPGAGGRDEELVAWVEGHHRRVRETLRARGAKLLVFDIDRDSGAELEQFLGVRVAWGQHNKTGDDSSRLRTRSAGGCRGVTRSPGNRSHRVRQPPAATRPACSRAGDVAATDFVQCRVLPHPKARRQTLATPSYAVSK
eukprot:CAMPEP_0176213454 /NCGR_PEP_ID=MMETSP0121_2-20121125/15667_1 /TAXON_ID=160619 /ORGANISM="Kryptoperidinium foliaceum, Strain CCMP 1326" /LENGTH=279 /DNA_ID=CAMNT_0017552517 /DNA_START=36 /DNA_END=873 /DNA_ORIENTATION=-